MDGKLETVRTLVELGVDKEAKGEVRNRMMMMIVAMIMVICKCFYNMMIVMVMII